MKMLKYLLNEQSCETEYSRILLYEKTEAVKSSHKEKGAKKVDKPTHSTLY